MSWGSSNRPSKTQQWPSNHGKLTFNLELSDRVLFGKVLSDGRIGYVGNTNNWQYCKAIIGHKEIKDLLEVRESGKIKIYTGSSIACESEDFIYTCIVDARGLLSSVGLRNVGKDVTIILHLQPQDRAKKGIEKEEKLKEFKYKFIIKHDPFNRLAEQINELETE